MYDIMRPKKAKKKQKATHNYLQLSIGTLLTVKAGDG